MDESTAPLERTTMLRLETGTDKEDTSTDEKDTDSNEAATCTMKDANDTRCLYQAIDSTSNPTKKMRIPSGDTVTWMISPSIKITGFPSDIQNSNIYQQFRDKEKAALYGQLDLSW